MSNTCCDRSPKTHLKNLDDAIAELKSSIEPLSSSRQASTEAVSISQALNRVLAKDIYSQVNVPPTDNSAVDGYTLNTYDIINKHDLFISQRIPAGHVPKPITSQSVARIFTGAPIPEGANCVVMQENVNLNADKTHISINGELSANQNIRPKGQDIKQGECILHKGKTLTPQRLGLVASIGIAEVEVFKPLTVAIFSTGDELVEPGYELNEGQIYNSNRYLLNGLLSGLNVNVLDIGVVEDNLEKTISAFKKATEEADVVITTGGASVGEEDYIQTAINRLGSVDFWKVAIKPGKPVMLGNINNTPILGLPGNPGAVFVTFMILARPFLLHQQGIEQTDPEPYLLPINFDIKKASIRREFLRVTRRNNQLEQHPNQSSGMLSSASWADGLAIIMENTAPKKGDLVHYIPFDSLLNLND